MRHSTIGQTGRMEKLKRKGRRMAVPALFTKKVMKKLAVILISISLLALIARIGCGGYIGKTTDMETVVDTVFLHKTDTVTVVSKPETKLQKVEVYVSDTSGNLTYKDEIERLRSYCSDVLLRLAHSNAVIQAQKSEMGRLESELKGFNNIRVDLPVNSYVFSDTSEATGVSSTVEFETFGYLKGDSIRFSINDTDMLIRNIMQKKRLSRSAIGIMADLKQEIGGMERQRAGLSIYRRSSSLTYGISGSTDIQGGEPYFGINFGIEISKKD